MLSTPRTIFLLLLGLLLSTHSSPPEAQADPSPSEFTTTSTSTNQIAYMDLALTAYDKNGGEISVDEAFSLYFRSDATKEWDPYDASKLLPRGDTWAAIAFKGTKDGEETLKAQESRPYQEAVQTVDVELIQKNMPAARYTITVQKWYSVPEDWSLRLRSEALDTTFVIESATDTAAFELGSSTTSRKTLPSGAAPKAGTDTTHLAMDGKVGPESNTLPVELSTFTAHLDGEQGVLRWETLSETNNSGFAVQHRQPSATPEDESWSRIGFVTGHGTTDEPQSYRFETDPLPPGRHKFRLKQVDHDGSVDLSDPIQIEKKVETTVTLKTAPNPFADQLNIELAARTSQTVTVQLFDVLGRMVKQAGPIDVTAHSPERLRFDGNRLSSGSYVLRVQGETFSTTQTVSRVQ